MTEKGIKKPELIFYLVSLLVLLIASNYLINGGLGLQATRSSKELWNLGHIAYFALLILLLGKLKFVANLSVKYQWLGLLFLTLMLGVLIEVLQYGTERTPDIADISRNLIGCFLVLSFKSSYLKLLDLFWCSFIKVMAIIILIISMVPLMIALADELIARSQFPVLSNFETPFEIDRWYGKASKEIVKLEPDSDSHQMKIELTTARYSGVGMDYMPAYWEDYDSVYLKLYYPYDDVLNITVRIHDLEHEIGTYQYEYYDRYHGKFQLKKGWNEIKIPFEDVIAAVKKRKMNLTQIRDISFFSILLSEPKTIYLDKVYLQ